MRERARRFGESGGEGKGERCWIEGGRKAEYDWRRRARGRRMGGEGREGEEVGRGWGTIDWGRG